MLNITCYFSLEPHINQTLNLLTYESLILNIAKLDIVIKYHAFKPEEIRHQKQTIHVH